MIDLHLSAFAPRWRFLYAVRIDAYLAAVVKADLGDLDFLFALISRGESQFDKATNEMIDNYIANMERRCNNG